VHQDDESLFSRPSGNSIFTHPPIATLTSSQEASTSSGTFHDLFSNVQVKIEPIKKVEDDEDGEHDEEDEEDSKESDELAQESPDYRPSVSPKASASVRHTRSATRAGPKPVPVNAELRQRKAAQLPTVSLSCFILFQCLTFPFLSFLRLRKALLPSRRRKMPPTPKANRRSSRPPFASAQALSLQIPNLQRRLNLLPRRYSLMFL
jgi:hypothetical protein